MAYLTSLDKHNSSPLLGVTLESNQGVMTVIPVIDINTVIPLRVGQTVDRIIHEDSEGEYHILLLEVLIIDDDPLGHTRDYT